MLIILVLPLLTFQNKNIDNLENRALSPKPLLIKESGINYSYGKEFESWFNDHIGGRSELLKIHLKLDTMLLGKAQNDKAIEGENGWLFYRAEKSQELFQNKLHFTDEEKKTILTNLENRNNWFKAKNIKFFLLIPPEKYSIYGDSFPQSIYRQNTISRTEDLLNFLNSNKSSLPIIFPVQNLISAKSSGKLVYLKNDTHWTNLGAYLAYSELMKHIKKEFPDIYILDESKMTYNEYVDTGGDLQQMLGIPGEKYADVKYCDPQPFNGFHFKYLLNNKGERKNIITENKHRKYKIIMLRDSFTTALLPYISESAGKVFYLWDFNINNHQDLILKEKPDVVILEVVERYLDNLLTEPTITQKEKQNAL